MILSSQQLLEVQREWLSKSDFRSSCSGSRFNESPVGDAVIDHLIKAGPNYSLQLFSIQEKQQPFQDAANKAPINRRIFKRLLC